MFSYSEVTAKVHQLLGAEGHDLKFCGAKRLFGTIVNSYRVSLSGLDPRWSIEGYGIAWIMLGCVSLQYE